MLFDFKFFFLTFSICRYTKEFQDGDKKFVNLARENTENSDRIVCLCKKCACYCHQHVDMAYEHLVISGMNPTYHNSVFHGEAPNTSEQHKDVKMTDTHEMYNNAYLQDYGVMDNPNDHNNDTTPRLEENEFTEKVKVTMTSLYLGCSKYTKISATVALYKHKIARGLFDNGFNELLQIICDMICYQTIMFCLVLYT